MSTAPEGGQGLLGDAVPYRGLAKGVARLRDDPDDSKYIELLKSLGSSITLGAYVS